MKACTNYRLIISSLIEQQLDFSPWRIGIRHIALRAFSDLHVHSHHSRATSEMMELQHISQYAAVKGLKIIGTGDSTHPLWIEEIKEKLVGEESGFLRPRDRRIDQHYVLSCEVSTIYSKGGSSRRVHHVILQPNIECAEQVNDLLSHFGDLESDGRPILNCSSPELVEFVSEVSDWIEIFPAHAWTPHFSIFGIHGFNSVRECYEDQAQKIHALETGLSCYDKETQVLTAEGWKNFDEVNYDDKICTLSIETNEIEFQKPLKVHAYQHKGKMYKLKTKRVDLLVTPNHKILYSPCDFRRSPKLVLKEAELLFNKSKRFKKDGIWKGENPEYFNLPAVDVRHGSRYYSGLRYQNEKRLPVKAWLKFFGFWMAEGWTAEGKNGAYNVCLCNTNNALLSEMKELLQSFGYNIYMNKKTGTIRVRDYQLFHYLKKFGKCNEKFVPMEIKALSKDNLELFLEYYVKGDGHIYGRTGRGLSATTTSIRLRDDLQEIALKVGMSAYYKLGTKKGTPFRSASSGYKKTYRQKDAWIVYFIRKNLHTVLPSTNKKYNYIESWVDFEGPVYCVTVPNHVIYIRRNGIPVWCGNSDPPMNWRLSSLDGYVLVSNSDSHSPWPWRLGREANLFDLEELSYRELILALRREGRSRMLMTVETHPQYGKYHWSGHRNCNIKLSPKESAIHGGICPKCGKRLTKGVEQRVNELADREMGYRPRNAADYVHLLPLCELIAAVYGIEEVSSVKVWQTYNRLIEGCGSEFGVMLEAQPQKLANLCDNKLKEAIMMVREDRVTVDPGYDGVYGTIRLGDITEGVGISDG